MRAVSALLGSVLLACAAPAAAQRATYTGVTLERLVRGDARLVIVNVRHTAIGRSGLGPDIASGLAPTYLPHLLLGLDPGLAWRLPAGAATVLLKAGPAGFFLIPDIEVIPGWQAGVAALVPLQRRARLRLDLARRVYYPGERRPLPMWSVGVGLAVLRQDAATSH